MLIRIKTLYRVVLFVTVITGLCLQAQTIEWRGNVLSKATLPLPPKASTDMVAAVPPDVLEKIVARIPVKRLGKAHEIARGVLFLVHDDAGFITGSTMSINGGQHMY